MKIRATAAAVLALLFPLASAASPRDVTVTDTYRASYDAKRDRYCLKFYASLAEGPRPGPVGQLCQSKAGWAKEGIAITRRPRAPTLAAR